VDRPRREARLPEVAELVAFANIGLDLGVVFGPPNLGVAGDLDEPEDFVELGRVQEVRRVRRDEDLSTSRCVGTELFGQVPQQRGVELVLGLLDAEQGVRRRVMQERQIGQHLDGAVGDVARQERILERAVLELQ